MASRSGPSGRAEEATPSSSSASRAPANARLASDDDDMEFEPTTDDTEEMWEDEDDDDDDDDDDDYEEDDDDDEGTEAEFLDAAEEQSEGFHEALADLLNAEAIGESTPEPDDAPEQTNANAAEQGRVRTMRISRSQILRLLSQSLFENPATIQFAGVDDDDDEDDEDYVPHRRRGNRSRRVEDNDKLPKIPSEAGRQLMESGHFGAHERSTATIQRKKKLAASIMQRELGLCPPIAQRKITNVSAQRLVPTSRADKILKFDRRCYSGQFSDDGNFFFTCSQDFQVRMYDTSNPYNWKYYKKVHYPFDGWTITDATLSPDNKWLAYSSIGSIVCLAETDPNSAENHPTYLDFAGVRTTGRFGLRGFGIYSIRFSGDGREIVAGTADNTVCVYDLDSQRTILKIPGHTRHVNAVCYGDKSSPHILYSGSDDTTIKVWDRRSLGDNREAGVFLGHREGLTYVDSKGDGRYVLSNGKDQFMRLWDLRKMTPQEQMVRISPESYTTGFEYRWDNYDLADWRPHPYDSSVVTFRGHKVLQTLIRCHFSPPGSSDGHYVYSGSADGCVYVYNLDSTLEAKIDVSKSTAAAFGKGSSGDFVRMGFYGNRVRSGECCVRDASWHPYAPVITATSWDGPTQEEGSCAVFSWNDGLHDDEAEPEMGQVLDCDLESAEPRRSRRRRLS